MRLNITAATAVTLALTGCVQTASIDTPFNESSVEYINRQGTATVTGQGFMRRRDGMVVYAAGSPVALVPKVPYTEEAFNKAQAAPFGINFTNSDPRLKKYVRTTQANGEGRFTFSNVPDGAYYLVTKVQWMAGDANQGGELTKAIQVSGGKNVDVILTR
ncbi:hypothetical protein [Brucella intermedia]|uniref:hypothetical protein n=1 Tax=Brucella intermedia TaxID=94625 RepID=UPI0007C81233|nr:hypothetical protein [Brucella intermedia]OAE39608.1 hypothetical protein A7J42_13930 [Brucella intermedia]